MAERMKEIRGRRGMTAAQLADRCAELGAPWITRAVIANIESGRPDKEGRRTRDVTVDELNILAYALEVAPPVLVAPVDANDRLRVTDELELDPLDAAEWLTADDSGVMWSAIRPTHRAAQPGWARVNRLPRDTRPLAIVRELARTIDRAEYIARSPAGAGDPEKLLADEGTRKQLSSCWEQIGRLSDWLESFDLTPPEVPGGLADLMQQAAGGEGNRRDADWHEAEPGPEVT